MDLVSKYNTSAPRYTSYPTVPYWDSNHDISQWKKQVKSRFIESNGREGISLYIHLPYCESLCTYCACNTRITINHKVELPYILGILKEWSVYLQLFDDVPRIKEIHLGGGTPTFFSPANLRKLLEGILSTAVVCPGAEFSFEGHPGNTTSEHLMTLNSLGFTRVSYGIQDFDETVQDLINRYQSFQQVKDIVEKSRELGYDSINFDLVYGLPHQTRQSVTDTIDKVLELRPERIAFYSYAHVPWLKPGQRKFSEKDLPADTEKRALYEIGRSKFLAAGYEEIGMDHFALPSDGLTRALHSKSLHRNFMGYTASYTKLMIGLGASSISDSWSAFAQNLKKVEDYLNAVNNGELPLWRGHELTTEDLIIRRHILNLMCRFETDWLQQDLQYPELNETVDRLQELEADSLVVLEPFRVKITETGKAFLRNICLCFDVRYWRKKPEVSTFSNSV